MKIMTVEGIKIKEVRKHREAWLPGPRQITFLYGVVLMMGAYCTNEPAWWLNSALLMGFTIFWEKIQESIKNLKRKYNEQFEIALRLGVTGAILTVWEVYSQKPAYAFLGRACAVLKKMTQVTNTGGEGTNSINGLIEATIFIVRGLFLVYLGIAVVNVIRQARNDEDWKTAAQTPLLAVVLIAAVEGISALIAPGVEGGC